MCAGVTLFDPLRRYKATTGTRVAIVGLDAHCTQLCVHRSDRTHPRLCMCMRVYGTMYEDYACHMRMRIHAHHMRRICMSYEEDMLEISCLRCAVTHYIA